MHISRLAKQLLWLALLLCIAPLLSGIEPPTPEALETYRKDGSLAKRAQFARRIGNHRVRPDVAQRTLARMRRLAGRPVFEAATVLPTWQGMPTKGTNNVLVFLIDFPDYPHVNSAELIASKLFGDGAPAEYPRESLRNYYRRSSYGQLEIQGDVLGWYRMQHNRSWYTSTYPDENSANRAIMQEVIKNYDSAYDFSQYDNNHDGEVDYVAIIWAGPDNGWANFWWGYQWSLNSPVFIDGVRFRTFSWQWESRPVGSAFEAGTIIHETGHALGLPDYYDYDSWVGPSGGVGGLDMMDGNYADHNAFSKFMLEWLQPIALPAGFSNLALQAMAQFPEAVAIMPDYTGASPFTEFFLVENRFRTNNDTGNPGDGLLIWHIDATPDGRGGDFLYNNSDTSHKLLRLMEADGLEEIERGSGKANAGDYYREGASFSDITAPNSRAYSGTNTYVTVEGISTPGPSMTLSCSVQGTFAGPRIIRWPSSLAPSALAGSNPADQAFYVVGSGGDISYAISRSEPWLSISPASGASPGVTNAHTITYSAATLSPGTYNAQITISAPGASNSPQTILVTLTIMGIDIGHAVNATNLHWSSGGAALWFEQMTVTHDSEAAAQSGAITHNETNWIETSVTGPGQLSFWWKVSSEQNYDYLRFYLDGQERQGRISGILDWQSVSVSLGGGTHSLRWAYTKDYSVSSSLDAGWVDQVQFIPTNMPPALACAPAALTQTTTFGQNAAPVTIEVWNEGGGTMAYSITADVPWLTAWPTNEISSGSHNQHLVSLQSATLPVGEHQGNLTISAPGASSSPKTIPVTLRVFPSGGALAEAVDFTNAVWTTGGDAPWGTQTQVTQDGTDAAQSGPIGHSQSSWLQVSLQGPGLLSFWWKISSEKGYDHHELQIDDLSQDLSITGEIPWQQGFVNIPAGTHNVRWIYSKDYSVASGQDAAWLDQVSFAPGFNGPETLLSVSFNNGLPPGWSVRDNIGDGAVWAFSDPGGRGNSTGGTGYFAIIDSDYWEMVFADTELITPALNLASHTNVVMEFKTEFLSSWGLTIADVDCKWANGSWQNIGRQTLDIVGPATLSLSVPQAAGKTNVMFRFHYYNAEWDMYWELDDIKVTATSLIPAWLKRPQLSINASFGTAVTISWQGEPDRQYTMLCATNLVTGPWLLAPGWQSNHAGVAELMTYTNLQPNSAEVYRILMR